MPENKKETLSLNVMKLNAIKVIIVNSRNEPAEENQQAVVGYLDKTRVKNLK